MIQKLAQDKAYEEHDDPIHAENEVKKQVKNLRVKFSNYIELAKVGKAKMMTVTPERCGRLKGAKLRSPRKWKFRKNSFIDAKGRLPYTREHFLRFGFIQHPNSKLVILSNDAIAPMALKHWHVTARQKRIMEPILRLASQFILSPASVKFLHAVIFNEPVADEAASRIWNLPMEEISYSEAQNASIPELSRQVMETLNELSEHVTWQLHDKNNPLWVLSKELPEMEAFTVKRRYVPEYQNLKGNGRRGADFFIDAEFMELLEKLHRDAKEQPDTEVIDILLRCRLKLAATLCHELAHAV